MHTKTIVQNINWLSEIDGMTVEKAIAYLSTLNPSHVLNYSMEGDTHGCEVVPNVCYDVPMTNAEVLAGLEKRYLKEIAVYEKAKADHVKAGRTSRAESCDINLTCLYSKLEETRAKYGSKP